MTPPTPALQAALLAALDDNPNASEQLRLLWTASRAICWRCNQLTKLSQASSDHVVPRALGGSNRPTNLRMACKPCNANAGNTLPAVPPPYIPFEGLKPYRGRTSETRNSVIMIVAIHGRTCWLCGERTAPEDCTRSRVRLEPGYGFALENLRIAHIECQTRRMRAHHQWDNLLSHSRARSARQRLVHRRRAVILRRQHHVLPRRNTWTKICAIVRSLFSRLCPSRRTHEPRPGTRHPRPSRR